MPISSGGIASDEPGTGAAVGRPTARAEPPESTAEVPEVHELLAMARECLDANDFDSALQACALARELEPDHEEAAAMSVWIRALQPGADLDELLLEFDEVLMRHPGSIAGRYYRAIVRRHLGDVAGAARDLKHVLALDPAHPTAARELAALGGEHPSPKPFAARRRK